MNSRARSEQAIVGGNLIKEIISKLKKKFFCGSDGICVRHFEFASIFLFDLTALLLQMIFTVGVVPDCLCVGVVNPVLKKRETAFVRLIGPL